MIFIILKILILNIKLYLFQKNLKYFHLLFYDFVFVDILAIFVLKLLLTPTKNNNRTIKIISIRNKLILNICNILYSYNIYI